MAKRWLIGVIVELWDQPVALHHYFAVGDEDRAKAEWKAIDQALLIGHAAVSQVGDLKAVHAIWRAAAQDCCRPGAEVGRSAVVGKVFAAAVDVA